MNFRFLPPALKEVDEAAHFYERKVAGLGFDFLTEVRATIGKITLHPTAWFPLNEKVRRCRLGRFPYAFIYAVRENEVVIISAMHLHRHPESWRKNLD